MKTTRAGKYIAIAGLASLLLASPALAQDPDCSAASRQYGPNCDETEVTVFDPTPPEEPGQPPVDDIDDVDDDGGTVGSIGGDVVIISPGDIADIADAAGTIIPNTDAAAAIGPDTGAAPVYETGEPATASATYPADTATAGGVSSSEEGATAGAVATLPDTGGAGWLVAGVGAALVSLALISRRIFLRS